MPTKPYKSKATEFSRVLSRYISECSYTIYKMSKMLGIDRTAIQHYIAGDALPKPENFESICSVLTITPEQKNELAELYTKERLGARTYYNRKAIKEMIENLPQYMVTGSSTDCIVPINQSRTTETVSGAVNVNNRLINAVADELKKDAACISTTIPFENSFFYDCVLQMLSMGRTNVRFDHYLRIYISDKDSPDNINIVNLESMLKMSLSTGFTYHPYGYYAYKNSVDDNMSPFPYCLATSDCAVMVSRDLTRAIVSSQEDVVEEIHRHIRKLAGYSNIMIDSVDQLAGFDLFMESSKNFTRSIEFEPCVTGFLTLDIISKRIVDIENSAELLNTVKDTFFTEEQIEFNRSHQTMTVFSAEGLEYFAETGIMLNLPGQLLTPLSKGERIHILKQLRSNLDKFCMIDSSKMTIPPFMQLISLNTNQCILSCIIKNRTFVCRLSETSLCSAIDDFIESIYTGGELILDNESVTEAVNSCIRKLESTKKVG